MAMLYGSWPVLHAADQMRSRRALGVFARWQHPAPQGVERRGVAEKQGLLRGDRVDHRVPQRAVVTVSGLGGQLGETLAARVLGDLAQPAFDQVALRRIQHQAAQIVDEPRNRRQVFAGYLHAVAPCVNNRTMAAAMSPSATGRAIPSSIGSRGIPNTTQLASS